MPWANSNKIDNHHVPLGSQHRSCKHFVYDIKMQRISNSPKLNLIEKNLIHFCSSEKKLPGTWNLFPLFFPQSSYFQPVHKFLTIEQHHPPPLSTCFINLLPMNQIFIKLSFESFCQAFGSSRASRESITGRREQWENYCGLLPNNKRTNFQDKKWVLHTHSRLRSPRKRDGIGMLKFIN